MVGGFTGSRKHGWVVPQGTSRPGPVAGLRFECGCLRDPTQQRSHQTTVGSRPGTLSGSESGSCKWFHLNPVRTHRDPRLVGNPAGEYRTP